MYGATTLPRNGDGTEEASERPSRVGMGFLKKAARRRVETETHQEFMKIPLIFSSLNAKSSLGNETLSILIPDIF